MGMPRRSARGNRRGPRQNRRRIAEAMTLLPAGERDILLHAHYSGWSVEQIANRFGLSNELVKDRLHDALQRLLATGVQHS
jgi:RNA polymerase sigma factor (sigma-70 family)